MAELPTLLILLMMLQHSADGNSLLSIRRSAGRDQGNLQYLCYNESLPNDSVELVSLKNGGTF